jgi:L-alanine-DL-glutamate epimerase-like enolase superfamily enzyme
MKITDVQLTLFAWDDIPATTYGRHTGRFSGTSQLGLVTIATDQGVQGHAFLGSAMRGAHLDGQSLIQFLKPTVLGQDPLDRERLYQAMWQKNRQTTYRAIGAMDIALWDIAGQVAGLPIHRLLGSYRDSVPAYASSAVLASKEAYAEEAVRFKTDGWSAYKIHPPTDPIVDIEVCRAVRGAVGDRFTVMLDSTWAYQFPEALRVGKAVEALGFYWYEDPLADDDLLSYVKLKQHLAIPILATEYSPGGLTAYAPWLVHQATDYLRGDVAVKGGITALVKAAHLPHELRGPPRRELAQQRGQPARDHGHPELRVLRGAVAGGRSEVRARPRHRGRPPGPRPRVQRAGAGGGHRLRAHRAKEGLRPLLNVTGS